MLSQLAVLATFVVAVAKPLAPSTTGWLYNDEFLLLLGRFVFPFTATQSPSLRNLFTITFPNDTGYVEWICNIPAGIAFNVDLEFNYTVLPGSSSDCLGDLTTTYSILSYTTANFANYTRTASLSATIVTTNALPTTTFPTGAFSTITLNPNLTVTQTGSPPTASVSHPTTSPPVSRLTSSPGHSSTVSSSSSSSPISSPPVSSSSKSSTALIGGVVGGGAALLLLLLVLGLLWRRRRRQSGRNTTQPHATSRPQSESKDPSLAPGHVPRSHARDPKSDGVARDVPATGNPLAGMPPVAQFPATQPPAGNGNTPPVNTEQTFERAHLATGGGAVGSGNVNVSNVVNNYFVHPLSSSLPHLPYSDIPTNAAPETSVPHAMP